VLPFNNWYFKISPLGPNNIQFSFPHVLMWKSVTTWASQHNMSICMCGALEWRQKWSFLVLYLFVLPGNITKRTCGDDRVAMLRPPSSLNHDAGQMSLRTNCLCISWKLTLSHNSGWLVDCCLSVAIFSGPMSFTSWWPLSVAFHTSTCTCIPIHYFLWSLWLPSGLPSWLI
jgi:hypothetical protein